MSSRSSAGGENKTKASKKKCFYCSFFTEKKFIQKSYSHSWEYRLITVDVWWALGGTNIVCSQVSWVGLGGSSLKLSSQNQQTEKTNISSSWDTQTHPFSYKTDVPLSTISTSGRVNLFFNLCIFLYINVAQRNKRQ